MNSARGKYSTSVTTHEDAERVTGYGENTRKERDSKEKTSKVPSLATLIL
jgi:hypothetical protein